MRQQAVQDYVKKKRGLYASQGGEVPEEDEDDGYYDSESRQWMPHQPEGEALASADPVARSSNPIDDIENGSLDDAEEPEADSPAVSSGESDKAKAVQDYVAQKYAPPADDGAVKEALDAQRKQNLIANLGDAFTQIATSRGVANGMQRDDGSFWHGMKAQGQQGVDQATKSRQQQIQDYLQQTQMNRQFAQDKERKDFSAAKLKSFETAREAKLRQDREIFDEKQKSEKEKLELNLGDRKRHDQEHNELMSSINASKAGQRTDASTARADAKHDKDFLTLQNALDPTKASSRSAYGKNQGVVDSADKVLTLGEQGKHQEKGLDSRQIHELAMAVGNLVSGGTGTAQATVEALVPRSVGTTSAAIEEWLTSNPTGTDQQQFVGRMLETAEREKHQATEKIKQTQSKILNGPAFQHLRDDPRFEMATVQTFDPENDKFDKNGVYQAKPFGQKKVEAPAPGGPGMAVAAPAGPSQVKIQAPDGAIRLVSPESVDKYVKKGGKVIP